VANVIDDRIVRVGFEINGQLKTFERLWIEASGTKFANPNQNECQVRINNLSKEDRDYLITETSPFNKTKKPKRLVIEAGRVSTGVSRIFVGDITECSPSQPPDISLDIKAKTANFQKGNIVSTTAPAGSSLTEIAAVAADQLGVTLQMEAQNKNISNASYNGSQAKMVDALGETGGVNAYIDNDVLVVKDYNVPLKNVMRILDETTGMIGIPEITEEGIKVKMLYDNKTVCGGGVQIKSVLNPAANGTYVIYKLSFDICSRDTAFYLTAEGKRLNG